MLTLKVESLLAARLPLFFFFRDVPWSPAWLPILELVTLGLPSRKWHMAASMQDVPP